ncbi:hypothetical protein [Mycobacterium sp.]|uniref:hypothetical protein n=1 Tax=Mycobacterium sp. TaxID=1785 RepID=UPI003F9C02B7
MTAAMQHEDASARSGKADGSRALIVTWNPDKGKWAKRPRGYHYAIEQTARGETVEEDWSTGNRIRGVSRGDRAFMLQQGNHGRGIIASGTVLGEIYQIPHWDPENHPGELANTVDIEWNRVMPVEYALTKEELNRQLPAKHRWSFQGSGFLIEDEEADQLEELWSHHLANIARNIRGHPAGGKKAAAELAEVAVDQVPPAAMNTERSEVEWSVSTTVTQKEAQLTSRFQMYLEKHDREVKRYRIIPVGAAATLYSDLADVTENILYEAQGSADRMSVRLALGQVLDYGRFVERSRLAVLLPEAPPADLVELLDRYGVGCVVETTPNEFLDMTTYNRCP